MRLLAVFCVLPCLALPTTSAAESRTNGLWLGLYSAPYPSLWSLGYRRELKPYLHALGALGHYPYLNAFAVTAGASVRFRHPDWAFSPFAGAGIGASYQTGGIGVGFTPWAGSGLKLNCPASVGFEWVNGDGLFLAWSSQFPLGAASPSVISGVEIGVLF